PPGDRQPGDERRRLCSVARRVRFGTPAVGRSETQTAGARARRLNAFHSTDGRKKSMKILLAVDGSQNAIRATESLIKSLPQYKEVPQIDVVTVHRPIPNVGNTAHLITQEVRDRYYKEECDEALAPTTALLDAAKVPYKTHRLVGQVAETIAQAASDLGSSVIHMGTHGRTGMSNIVMGSV